MWEREIQEGEREAIIVELMVDDVKELLDLRGHRSQIGSFSQVNCSLYYFQVGH